MKKLTAIVLTLLMLVQMCPSVGLAAGSIADGGETVVSGQLNKPVYHTVVFTVNGDVFTTFFVADGAVVNPMPVAPEIPGQVFTGWYDGDDVFTGETLVTIDKVIEAVYKDADITIDPDNQKTLEFNSAKYSVTISFSEESGIPDEAVLIAREVTGADYLADASEALGWTGDDTVFYTKFIDLSIDNETIEFNRPVTVTVKLNDITEAAEALEVVSFVNGKAQKIASQADTDGTVRFTTNSFTTFGFGSALKPIDSWETEKASYSIQGFRGQPQPLVSTVDIEMEKGLEVLDAYTIQAMKGGPVSAPHVKVDTDLELKERESIVIYAIRDGIPTSVLDTSDENLSQCISLGSASGFAVVLDTGYREKSFQIGDVELDGMMPKASKAESEKVNVDLEGEVLAAYDIRILENGIKYQPDEKHPVDVSISVGDMKGKLVHVWHIEDDGSLEEIEEFEIENETVRFTARGFSIYAVTSEESTPRLFYTFINGSTVLASEYITSINEFYDPGVSPDYGQTFLGWAYDAAETNENNMLSFEQLKADVEAILAQGFEDGTEIKVYAKFKEAYYLRYMVIDDNGDVAVLKSNHVRVDAANKTVTVNCDYTEVGSEFTGWIDAISGTAYQNGDSITLDHHIDLYAKLAGRYWLVFNANTTGATFTGPQLIHDGIETFKPNDPTKKGYVFIGWNSEPDGSGTWWYKADGSQPNQFGESINEDTTLYGQWAGAPNSYTILYWKQCATDDVGLDNAYKHYDLVENVTVTDGVVTDGLITLPAGYKNKGTTTNENSNYYQTRYSWDDLEAGATVAADGSTIINIYYDRLAYHLYFQDYQYTPTTSNNGTQYGIVDGEYVMIYYRNRAWRTSNSNFGTVYSGTRYTRSSSMVTIMDIYTLYEHKIADEFPITGNNGITYNHGERWKPLTNSQGWTQVMVFVETMPPEDVTFQLDIANRPKKTMNYYVEALPGTENTVPAPTTLYAYDNNNAINAPAGKTYELYNSIIARYNGVSKEDFFDLAGFDQLGADKQRDRNEFYIYSETQDGTINFYYTRKIHKIIYYSNGSKVAEQENVPYGANVKSYADAQPSPTNGEDGYYFVGWYEDSSCTVPLQDDMTIPDGDVILYAKWDTYRVRTVFVPGCTDYWFANNQGTTFRIDYGESVSFANVKPGVAKRPGYILTGWYLTPDYSGGPVNTDNDYPITIHSPGVNMEYQSTADWTNNTYGDNDGEHGDVKGILKFYACWQLDVDENSVYFLYEVEDGYCIFDGAGNNQTSIPVDATGHLMGTSLQIADAPTGYSAGVDFRDWMVLSKTGGATSVTQAPGNTIILTFEEWSDYIDRVPVSDDSGNVSYMQVIRLRARFTAKEDKATSIVFHGNGGTMSGGVESYTQVVPVNATIDLTVQSAAFTREHYTIIGWNTEADGSGTTFTTTQEIYANNEGLEAGESNHLYAVWQAVIEITAVGPDEAVIFDGEQHSTTGTYTFTYTLGDEPITEAELAALGITVTISPNGWPVATGIEKGEYVADGLTDAQLESLITIEENNYNESYEIRRVYVPARLTIRDLLLTVNKIVTGAFGDQNKPFTFTLTAVEGMASGSFKITITHVFESSTTVTNLSIGGSFWMRHGDTVAIEGLPKGKNITLTENNGMYIVTWTLASTPGDQLSGNQATIVLQDDDVLVVENYLPPVAPTGYGTATAPYILMLMVGLALVLMLMRRRKGGGEDA